MDSPGLDGVDPVDLSLEELLRGPCQEEKCMDVDHLALPADPFSLDDAAFFPADGVTRSARGTDDLLRAALRSHQDAPAAPSATQMNARSLAAAAVKQQINNAAGSDALSTAPPAAPAPAPPAKAVATRAVLVVKAEPGPVPAPQASQQTQLETDTDDMGSGQGGKGTTKRRRRIRNAKQQELNRLAQQRYRERKKQKYSHLQGTVDELSVRLGQLNTLEAANSELLQRNCQLEVVVKDQQAQLHTQQATIAKQARQLSNQAQQLSTQAQQLKQQEQRIDQQDRQVAELHSRLAAASQPAPYPQPMPAPAAAGVADEQLSDQLALAVRAVLTGVSSMASVLPAKDAQQMQHMVSQLPDSLLQQIRSCCREVALHLKNTEVKEQPHAIQVPCC